MSHPRHHLTWTIGWILTTSATVALLNWHILTHGALRKTGRALRRLLTILLFTISILCGLGIVLSGGTALLLMPIGIVTLTAARLLTYPPTQTVTEGSHSVT